MTQPKAHQGTDEITCQIPQIPSSVEVHDVPIVRATDESLGGYGKLVDDPEKFTAFFVEAGMGLYIHPGVWHNAVYVKPEHAPTHIFGRQGKVHARISVRWTEEFNKILRVPLPL